MKVKKLHPDARLPTYATPGAACFDLYAVCDAPQDLVGGERSVIRTGLAFDIPQGYAMMVYSRSGHGFKNGVRLANCVGVIDSDYTGEVMVKLTCDEIDGGFVVATGDRIAQAMVIPVEQVYFEEVDELKTTARGAGGFGSTGV